MSCFREIDIKYKGREIDRDSNGEIVRIVYQGTKELCNQAMNEDYFIGSVYEYGLLETMKMTQDEGPIWNLELVFKKSNDGNKTNSGPSKSSLNVRMLGLPLERHKNYRLRWDHNLYTTWDPTKSLPTTTVESIETIWKNATYNNDLIPNGNKFIGTQQNKQDLENNNKIFLQWGKFISECPALPNGRQWNKIGTMIKPRSRVF